MRLKDVISRELSGSTGVQVRDEMSMAQGYSFSLADRSFENVGLRVAVAGE